MPADHPRVLLLSLEGAAHGTAYLSHALSGAGFRVALARRGRGLAATRGLAGRVFTLPRRYGAALVPTQVGRIAAAWRPDLILPTDGRSVRLLHYLAHHYNRFGADKLSIVAERSVGMADSQVAALSRVELLRSAGAQAAAAPPFRILQRPGDAARFIGEHGFPVVLEPEFADAAAGVVLCGDERDLDRALSQPLVAFPPRPDGLSERLRATAHSLLGSRSAQAAWWLPPRCRMLIRKHVAGELAVYHLAAWQGQLLAGAFAETAPGSTPANGDRDAQRRMADHGAAMAASLGFSGLGRLHFRIPASGQPQVIAFHPGAAFDRGLDRSAAARLADALYGAATGTLRLPMPTSDTRTARF